MVQEETISPNIYHTASFLAGGGEMGELMRSKDWSSNPLGPVEQWPQSLKTIVRIMLTTRSNWCVWNHWVCSLSVRT